MTVSLLCYESTQASEPSLCTTLSALQKHGHQGGSCKSSRSVCMDRRPLRDVEASCGATTTAWHALGAKMIRRRNARISLRQREKAIVTFCAVSACYVYAHHGRLCEPKECELQACPAHCWQEQQFMVSSLAVLHPDMCLKLRIMWSSPVSAHFTCCAVAGADVSTRLHSSAPYHGSVCQTACEPHSDGRCQLSRGASGFCSLSRGMHTRQLLQQHS